MSTRRTSVMTLVVAAVAVSSAAVGAIAGPAHAAQTDPSTISIRIPHSHIEAGSTVKVLGDLHVRGGAGTVQSGRPVTLEARPAGSTSFTPVGSAVSGPNGGLSYAVAPTVNTKYRWDYAGAADARGSKSGVARIVIVADQHPGRKLHTSLSIRSHQRVAGDDGSALVRGRLRTGGVGLRNRVVDLVTRTAASPTWQVIGQQMTDSHGVVRFPIQPAGAAAYRLVFEGTPVFHASHSGIVRVAVRPVVTAVAAPAWVDPGQTATVSGTATLAGQPLAGAAVDLVAWPVGKTHAKHVVASGLTGADGSVVLTDAPTASTAYRLVVRHGAGVPTGTSPTVKVQVRATSSLSVRGRTTPAGFVVSGQLRAAKHVVAHAQVDLQGIMPDGTWFTITSGFTNKHGKATFLEPVSAGANYRLSYAGGTKFGPCVSGTVVN